MKPCTKNAILIKSVTQVRSKLFNFRLKSQLEVALHQHKVLEGELERSKAEVEEQVDTFKIKTMTDYKVLYVFGEEYVRGIYSKVCRAKDNAREEVLELRLKLKDLEASLARRKEVGAADLYSSVVLMMISRDG